MGKGRRNKGLAHGGQRFVPQTVLQTQSYTGPLPQASDFQAYEDALPGAAQQILDMARDHAAHQREMESKAIGIQAQQVTTQANEVRLQHADVRRGQIVSFLVAAIVLGIFTLFVLKGYATQALVGVLAELAVLTGVYISRTDRRN